MYDMHKMDKLVCKSINYLNSKGVGLITEASTDTRSGFRNFLCTQSTRVNMLIRQVPLGNYYFPLLLCNMLSDCVSTGRVFSGAFDGAIKVMQFQSTHVYN